MPPTWYRTEVVRAAHGAARPLLMSRRETRIEPPSACYPRMPAGGSLPPFTRYVRSAMRSSRINAERVERLRLKAPRPPLARCRLYATHAQPATAALPSRQQDIIFQVRECSAGAAVVPPRHAPRRRRDRQPRAQPADEHSAAMPVRAKRRLPRVEFYVSGDRNMSVYAFAVSLTSSFT